MTHFTWKSCRGYIQVHSYIQVFSKVHIPLQRKLWHHVHQYRERAPLSIESTSRLQPILERPNPQKLLNSLTFCGMKTSLVHHPEKRFCQYYTRQVLPKLTCCWRHQCLSNMVVILDSRAMQNGWIDAIWRGVMEKSYMKRFFHITNMYNQSHIRHRSEIAFALHLLPRCFTFNEFERLQRLDNRFKDWHSTLNLYVDIIKAHSYR